MSGRVGALLITKNATLRLPCSNDQVPAISFDEVFARHPWSPIPGCPGRWVLRGARSDLGVSEVVGADVPVTEHHVPSTPDAVIVVRLRGGGLITFRKSDGLHVHTLNTDAGLERRLARLGIA